MKRTDNLKNILKVLGIIFLAYVVLSWIIPSGTFSKGVYTKGSTYPLGLGDIIMYPIALLLSTNFIVIGLTVLLIGGAYGVMNKTGVYTVIVDKIVEKFSKNKSLFLVITIIFFAILASLTTLSLPLFALVPFFVAIILLLGYDKFTAFISTIGAILVGTVGSTFGYATEGYDYFNILFGNKMTTGIAAKVVMLVVCVAVLIFFVITTSKLPIAKVEKKKTTKKVKEVETKEEKKIEIPFYVKSETKSKRKVWPLVIVAVLAIVLAFTGMYAWAAVNSKITVFTDVMQNIKDYKLNGFALFANLLGTSNPYMAWTIGNWGNYDFIVILVVFTALIGWLYNLKTKDIIKAFVSGVKEMLPVALVAVAANIIYLTTSMLANYVGGSMVPTICNVVLNGKMNYFQLMGATILGSPFYNELPYLGLALQDPITNLVSKVDIVPLIMQSVYGFMKLVLPTSVLLVVGLSYTGVSLKEYYKKSWKLLLALLVAILLVLILFIYCPGIKLV